MSYSFGWLCMLFPKIIWTRSWLLWQYGWNFSFSWRWLLLLQWVSHHPTLQPSCSLDCLQKHNQNLGGPGNQSSQHHQLQRMPFSWESSGNWGTDMKWNCWTITDRSSHSMGEKCSTTSSSSLSNSFIFYPSAGNIYNFEYGKSYRYAISEKAQNLSIFLLVKVFLHGHC